MVGILTLTITLAWLTLAFLIRGQLVHTRRATLIDLTNHLHTLDGPAYRSERDRAATALPDLIRRLQWAGDSHLAQALAITAPPEREQDAQLIASARRALASHASRYPTA